MKSLFVFKVILPVCLLALLLFTGIHNTKGQNFSGLQGKELSMDISGKQVIGNLIDKLLYGNDFNGNISSVKVLEDAEMALGVAVNYTGYEGGYVHVSVTDDHMNLLKGFSPQKVRIEKDKQQVSVKLEADYNKYADNEQFVAPRLMVVVSKSESGAHGVRMMYKLEKRFVNKPDVIIIPVSLIPVESAAQLPKTLQPNNPNPTYKLPAGKVKMIDKPLYYNYVSPQSAKIVTQPTATTTAPAPQVYQKKAVVNMMVVNPAALSRLSTNQPAAPSAPAINYNPQGADNNPISLWADFIASDIDFESQAKITSISLNIFPDKNPHSGVFYYLPIAYDLKYDKEKGFAFNIDYGTSRTEGAENRVRMSGILSSGISLFETQFINNLVDIFKKQNPQIKVERAVPLPISETPVITLGNELKNFGITSLTINNTTSISDPVEFSWLTDGTTASEIESLLKANSGIVGSMKIKPAGGNIPVQDIPVRIRLIDENTFGRFTMPPSDLRNKNWRNTTPFPVKLKYIHCMIIDKMADGKEGPIIYSWDLNGKEIPSKMQVKFDSEAIPRWLDNHKGKQARIWIDYSIIDTCRACNTKVFADIVGSTTRPQLADVVFRVLPFFETYKVNYLDVEIRSMQGDAAGGVQTSFPVVHMNRDSTSYTAARLYVPPGQEPSFEYRVTLVTKEGAEMTSAWKTRNSLNTPFGSHQLLELFPSLKQERP